MSTNLINVVLYNYWTLAAKTDEFYIKQARKARRCDSYPQIWNYVSLALTHSLTDPLTGVGARRCYRIKKELFYISPHHRVETRAKNCIVMPRGECKSFTSHHLPLKSKLPLWPPLTSVCLLFIWASVTLSTKWEKTDVQTNFTPSSYVSVVVGVVVVVVIIIIIIIIIVNTWRETPQRRQGK